jgi:hypothetical protein
MLSSGALSSLGRGGVLITLGYFAANHDRCDRPDLETRADSRLLSVRPITDGDRQGMAGHRPLIVGGSAKPTSNEFIPSARQAKSCAI